MKLAWEKNTNFNCVINLFQFINRRVEFVYKKQRAKTSEALKEKTINGEKIKRGKRKSNKIEREKQTKTKSQAPASLLAVDVRETLLQVSATDEKFIRI